MGFPQTEYVANEDAQVMSLSNGRSNESLIELSVNVTEGNLNRALSLMVNTIDREAIGVYTYVFFKYCILLYMIGSSDFEPLSNSVLTFTSSTLEQSVTIKLIPDDVLENNETFLVSLMSDDPAVVLSPNIATVTIRDNDCMLQLYYFLFYIFTLVVVVKWDIADQHVNESVGQVDICFTLMGELERNIEVVASPTLDSVAFPASRKCIIVIH